MSYNKAIYNTISVFRNKYSLNVLNTIANIDDYNIIINNLYLGNINKSTDIDFLQKNNIQAIINCTENEPFSDYFDDKLKLRLPINDSKDDQNIDNFKSLISESIKFINNCLNGLVNSSPNFILLKFSLTSLMQIISFFIVILQ